MAGSHEADENGFVFTWILENFPYFWHKKGEKIVSPAFIVNTMENTKWRLWIYPRGVEDDNLMIYYLIREEDSKGPAYITINCEISLLHGDGLTIIVPLIKNLRFFEGKKVSMFGKCEMKNSFVTKGKLTIRCRMWKAIGKVSKDGIISARTRLGVERRSFVWEIDEFNTIPCNNKRSIFLIKSASNNKLIMTLNLFLTVSGPFSIINCATSDPEISIFTLKVMVLDTQGGILECGQGELLFNSINSTKQLKLSLSKQQLMAKRSLYLSNGVLTLRCECSFTNKVISEEIEEIIYGLKVTDAMPEDQKSYSTNTTVSNAVSALKTDLLFLFNERTFCDVMVNTKTDSFPAHWLLLSARSPVFRAMYNSNMKEKMKNCIIISDIDADTVRRMLLYIYTDSLEDVHWEMALKLYMAADKYAILSLKKECSAFLKDNLCEKNCCEVLVLADTNDNDGLKKHVQDFILKHDRVVMRTPEWELLMKIDAKLAAETMFLKYKE